MSHVKIFFFLLGIWLFSTTIFSQNLTVTKVGEWGTGQYSRISVQGNYAYCTAGYNGLYIIDITNPSDPQKVGHYDTPGKAKTVYTNGHYSYILEEERGLLIIDVSSPSAPFQVGDYSNLDISHNKGYIYVEEQYAYITDYNGLHITDVSTPSTPLRVAFYQTPQPGIMYKIVLNGHHAYVTNGVGFYVFDVSNPSKPELIGTYEDFSGVRHIFISNHYAYIEGYDNNEYAHGFQIVDISNPAVPYLVSTSLHASITAGIYVSGNYLYQAATSPAPNYEVSSGIKIYDISNPSSPTYAGKTNFYLGSTSGLSIVGQYAYLTNTYTGLKIFDISNPVSPILTGSCQTIRRLKSVYTKEPYVFAVGYDSGLVVLDVSNPSFPVWVGYLETPGLAEDVFVSGNYAYVADCEEGLQVIDISDPTTPTLTGNYETANAVGIFINGNTAYVADGAAGLKIINISTPSAPSLLGQYDTEAWAANVFVSGHHAYVAEKKYEPNPWLFGIPGSFKILDISDPSTPVLVGEETAGSLTNSFNVFVKNTNAYVTTTNGKFYILDISTPSSPTVTGDYEFPGSPLIRDIYCSGNYAYLTPGSLKIFDISVPSAPQLAVSYTNMDSASGVFVSSNYIYVGDKNTGKVYILQTGSTSPAAQLSLSRSSLSFGADNTSISTGTQRILLRNSGSGVMEWSASADQEWLKCSPPSGTNDSELFAAVNAGGLNPGTYTGTITVSSAQAVNSPQTVAVTFNVYTSGQTSMPFGTFATPLEGSTASGGIPVTGWVLDDIGSKSVKIYREDGNSLLYIGDAVFVEGARPDVEEAYPAYPQNYRAGWGYMLLTNFLPNGGNGIFVLHVIAADFEGHQVTLGTKTIDCRNAKAVKPFGTIDTPGHCGTASGREYANFGWVLTPLPNTIPTDGSTITVWVDGVALGNPVYNRFREDIATLFPGYNNSEGAVGLFYLDTTQHVDGVHTIAWTVADDAGNSDGIGSRYFNVQNAAEARSMAHGAWKIGTDNKIPFDVSTPVQIKKGYKTNIAPQTIYPDNDGIITIEINQLERLEIHLDNLNSSSSYSGYQQVGHQLKSFPIGSTFDPINGIFYWLPGPACMGNYEFVFIEKTGVGEGKKKIINVQINPREERLRCLKEI